MFLYEWFHLYGYCLLHILTPFSLFLLSFLFPFLSLPTHQNAEGNCEIFLPIQPIQTFNRVYAQSTVSEKITSRSMFQWIGYRPAVTHPSTDPAPSCLTWIITWHRNLPHTERCRSSWYTKMTIFIFYTHKFSHII